MASDAFVRLRVALAGIALVALCAAPATAQEALRIGVIVSTSGQLAGLGHEAKAAIELAAAASKVKIILYSSDDRSHPDAAIQLAQKFVGQDKVHAIVGPITGATTAALVKIAEVPVISLAPVPPRTPDRSDFMFRIGTTEGHLMLAAQEFIEKDLKAKRLGVVGISPDVMPNDRLQGAFEKLELSGRVQDARGTSAALKNAKAIYLSAREPAAGDAVRAMHADPALKDVPIVAAALHGVGVFQGVIDTGAYAVVVHDDSTKEGKAFYEAYRKANDRLPLYGYGARAYSAIQVLEQAWSKAGGDPKKLQAALAEQRFATILGQLTLKPGAGCSALPLAVRRLDVPRTLVHSVIGGSCTCNDEGCCKDCCDGQKKACNQNTTCTN